MKISYNWLKQYIKVDIPPLELENIFTNIGLEVEGIEKFESIKGGLEGVVVGHVLECEKHENADKLSVTKVDIGEAEPLPIVCGAPNVTKGQKVLVATVGTTLYPGDETFTIKKAKIRGEVSEGMICAEDELGIGNSHDGIIVLPEETKVGLLAKELYEVENDTIFEIGLTPNRVDAASHIGVARDLAAYLSMDKPVEVTKPGIDDFRVDNNDLEIPVSIENTEACPRYAGVTLKGVKVTTSPEWLQNRLKAIGLKPINNVVDITNFVLMETGHPLHAFDAKEIVGNKIVVKNLPKDTEFTTLDEVERKLSPDDLMICNVEKGMALAGVFGGLHSGVTDTTENVFIESAYFNPVSIRKSAKRHTLSTDASFRFERGADPEMVIYALKRAALLIKEIAGGTISSNIVDEYPVKQTPFQVSLSYFNLRRLIGKELDNELVKKIITSLDIKIKEEHERGLELEVPCYRVDVKREVDVIEEVLRIYGYNNVEISNKVQSTLTYVPKPDPERMQNLVSDFYSHNGFNEIWSNSLTTSKYYEALKGYKEENTVKILNALSTDLNCMRRSLIFGGLEAIQRNANRQNPDLQLYEFGSVYEYSNNPNLKGKAGNYSEHKELALFITGNKTTSNWLNGEQATSFYYLKSNVENGLKVLNISTDKLVEEEIHDDVFFSAGILIKTKEGHELARYGVLNASIASKFGIDNDVFCAVMQWKLLLDLNTKSVVTYTELPKFPEVRRDLALLVDSNVSYKELKEIALKTENNLLKKVFLFDIYTGKNLPEGKKSYGLGFILQDTRDTLTDKKIDKIMNKLSGAYKHRVGAELR